MPTLKGRDKNASFQAKGTWNCPLLVATVSSDENVHSATFAGGLDLRAAADVELRLHHRALVQSYLLRQS